VIRKKFKFVFICKKIYKSNEFNLNLFGLPFAILFSENSIIVFDVNIIQIFFYKNCRLDWNPFAINTKNELMVF
jgi:hypothetical protein